MSFGKSYCEPVYLISEVATILSIHPQTLRQYEREGLVTPSRTRGKIRLYSQEDIDYIKSILILTRDCGINIAGVSRILQLEEKVKQLELLLGELKAKGINETTSKALVVKKSQYDIIVFEE